MPRWLVALFLLPAAAQTPSYSGAVSAILARRCATCHRPGEIGPMPLTSYAEVRPWAKAIREVVLERKMPPWPADPSVGARFLNDRSLTPSEIQTLTAWVDSGAPQGQPSAAPAAPPSEPASPLPARKPDLVIRIPSYPVPASGTLEYTFLVTPTNLPADTWISAAVWKIEHRAVVHHINAFIRPPGSSYVAAAPPGQLYVASAAERSARRPDETEVDRRELLAGYEPGYRPQPWGPGRAKLLRRGSAVVFEMHYTPNGTPVADHSELDIYFASAPPRERVLTITPADANLAIPPGDPSYPSQASATFTAPVTLVSLQPHMHLRGKSYRIDAVFPNGRRLALLSVPHYDFHWQTTFFLAHPLSLPTGAVIECSAVYDNSPNNPNNPDPSKTVTWGDQSWDEMNIGFLEVAIPAAANPNVAVLSGTTRPAPTSASR